MSESMKGQKNLNFKYLKGLLINQIVLKRRAFNMELSFCFLKCCMKMTKRLPDLVIIIFITQVFQRGTIFQQKVYGKGTFSVQNGLVKGKCLGLGLEPLRKQTLVEQPTPLPWGEGLLKSGRQLGSKERLVHFSYLGWNVPISGPSQSVFLFYNLFDPIQTFVTRRPFWLRRFKKLCLCKASLVL